MINLFAKIRFLLFISQMFHNVFTMLELSGVLIPHKNSNQYYIHIILLKLKQALSCWSLETFQQLKKCEFFTYYEYLINQFASVFGIPLEFKDYLCCLNIYYHFSFLLIPSFVSHSIHNSMKNCAKSKMSAVVLVLYTIFVCFKSQYFL